MTTVTISVKVIPRSSADAVVGWVDGVLKLRVTAPPADGRANAAVEALLAHVLGMRKSAVRIVGGHTSAHKRVAIEGADRADVERCVAAAVE